MSKSILSTPKDTAASDNIMEEGHFQFEQTGFLLNGECTVKSGISYILIATIGQHIAGTSQLPNVKENFAQNSEYLVNFSMQIDSNLVVNNVDEDVVFTLMGSSKKELKRVPSYSILLDAMASYEDIEVLAPSYGFFGGGKLEPLIVSIEEPLTSLTLSLDEKNFLNIRQLKIYGDDKNVLDLAQNNAVLSFSSSVDETQKASSFNNNSGFHSKLEDNPWLTITFSEPTYVSTIEIGNRADKWGIRSKKLNIAVSLPNQTSRLVYNAFSDKAKADFYRQLIQPIGLDAIVKRNDSRLTLLTHLYELLLEKHTSLSSSDFTYFLQFLSIWGEIEPSVEEYQVELKIFSLYVFCATQKSIGFTFLPFSDFLKTSAHLDFVEAEVNRLRSLGGLGALHITKHGLAHQGLLTKHTDMVLRSIEIIMNDLEMMGLKPCLAYGTLLGAVRDNAFIPHDDDVDLFVEYPEATSNFEDVYEWTDALLQKLDKEKYRTDLEVRGGNNLNIHIAVIETGMVIDIFPYWKEDSKCFMHMEKMKIRGIDAGIFEQRCKVKLYDKEFPAPGKPEQFLLERYGETWSVSDKYHEWPWPLNDNK